MKFEDIRRSIFKAREWDFSESWKRNIGRTKIRYPMPMMWWLNRYPSRLPPLRVACADRQPPMASGQGDLKTDPEG